jgi:hypothetical protein
MKPTDPEPDSPDPDETAKPGPVAAPESEAVADLEAVLRAAGVARALADQRERDIVRLAARWAALNPCEPVENPEVGDPAGLLGPGLLDGVADGACAEFAAALGTTTLAGADLIGDAVELSGRLPRTWAQLKAGRVTAWRARRIAQHAAQLTDEAAAEFDALVAGVAGRVGRVKLHQLVGEVMTRLMPEGGVRLSV